MLPMLDQSELHRYDRHFPVIGLEGQRLLKHAKILCVGAGGLGSPALQYLAAAGIGTLGIMDADQIELSNLQRQILFHEQDVGRYKAEVIAERLSALNHHVSVQVYVEFLSMANAQDRIEAYDVVLDATDNYQARYLLNEVCRMLKKPLISASIYQFDAQISVFNYKNGPCYQCLYPEPPPATLTPNCAVGGVLGVLPGVAGTLQANEAIKVILGLGQVLSGTLLSLDLLTLRFNQFEIVKQDCLNHPVVTFDASCASSCSSQSSGFETIRVAELKQMLARNEKIQLIDVRESYEREIAHMGGEHIPLGLFEAHIEKLDRVIPIVVYCKSGGRSAKACQMLVDAGFKHLSNLEGGMLEWMSAHEA
ncbi:MAG: ThiF family adenylyltransferase [Gammaproteobacteria bacterium]|nr:ThiF family adenylyltransferase [Gammaproteobacteria bacterium]